MIKFTKIVPISELSELSKDLQYTKIDIYPCKNKKIRDIKITLYLKTNYNEVNTIKGKLLEQSANKNNSKEVKEKLGGYLANFVMGNWMTLADFKEMMKLNDEYKLNLSVPKKYRKYIK